MNPNRSYDYCENFSKYLCNWPNYEVMDVDGCTDLEGTPFQHSFITTAAGVGPFIPTLLGKEETLVTCNSNSTSCTSQIKKTQKFVKNADVAGYLHIKVQPHLPDWNWKDDNGLGPICVFDQSRVEHLDPKAVKEIGLMDCRGTLRSGDSPHSNESDIGHLFSVGNYGDITIDIIKLLNSAEKLDRPSGKNLKNPAECAPRSRGGQFQMTISMEQAEDEVQVLGFMTLKFPKHWICWFGKRMWENWLVDLMGTHHWQCFRLRIRVRYFKRFYHEHTESIKPDPLYPKHGSKKVDRRQFFGFAFLLQSQTGHVSVWSLPVLLLTIVSLSWLLSMPRLVCQFLATHFGEHKQLHTAAICRCFNRDDEMYAWAIKTLAQAEGLKKVTCDGVVNIHEVVDQLEQIFKGTDNEAAREGIQKIKDKIAGKDAGAAVELSDLLLRVQKDEVVNLTRLAKDESVLEHFAEQLQQSQPAKLLETISHFGEDSSDTETEEESHSSNAEGQSRTLVHVQPGLYRRLPGV